MRSPSRRRRSEFSITSARVIEVRPSERAHLVGIERLLEHVEGPVLLVASMAFRTNP